MIGSFSLNNENKTLIMGYWYKQVKNNVKLFLKSKSLKLITLVTPYADLEVVNNSGLANALCTVCIFKLLPIVCPFISGVKLMEKLLRSWRVFLRVQNSIISFKKYNKKYICSRFTIYFIKYIPNCKHVITN